jgi:20S proteasome alpha/beta subunit
LTPKPRQVKTERLLSGRKAVTIAIGILAADGIVIAADTQETVGSHKADESKLLIANQGSERDKAGAIVVTGAGDSGYLDSINQELCAAFLRKRKWTPATLFAQSKKHVKQFHHDHVVPFSNFPEHDRPQASLIIGAHIDGSCCLWSTEKSTLATGKKHCSVGLGRAYAQVMLRRFWAPMDTVKAASLAAFVIFHVKNTVDGCGSQTQIVILKNGHAAYVSQPNINLLECAFEEYSLHENMMLHFILGLDLMMDDIKSELMVMSTRLKKDREDIGHAQQFTLSSYHRGRRPLEQPEMVRDFTANNGERGK